MPKDNNPAPASDGSTAEKRTNSLAFSRTPCHTCSSAQRDCDRRRPRCGTCLRAGVSCAGFATPLTWDSSRIWLGRNGSQDDSGSSYSRPSQAPAAPKTRFIDGHPNSKKRRAAALTQSAPEHSAGSRVREGEERRSRPRSACADPSAQMPFRDVAAETDQTLVSQRTYSMNPCQPAMNAQPDVTTQTTGPSGAANSMTAVSDFSDFLSTMYNPLLEPNFSAMIDSMSDEPAAWADFTSDLAGDSTWDLDLDAFLLPDSRQQTLPPQVAAVDHVQPAGAATASQPNAEDDRMMHMYNNELCVLPITSDAAVNPFRPQQRATLGSDLLSRAILALCFQNLNHQQGDLTAKVTEHQTAALELLEKALRAPSPTLQLLDPMLVLFTLDCAASASGPWLEHLKRITYLLKSVGGPKSLSTSHTRSQVGMVIWWDATLALISRQGLHISTAYLDYIRNDHRNDEWSFFDITGCPGDLVGYLVRVAELAEQSEIANTKTWLTFDRAPARKLFHDISVWRLEGYAEACSTPSSSSGEDPRDPADPPEEGITEAELQLRQDRHHCAEAWRHALLLYIERVFFWDRDRRPSLRIKSLARKTLDHVSCCRRTSQLQKQLLLPVFLAGSESGDQYLRQFAVDYCRWWADCSRYNMFNTAPGLLEEIWDQDGKEGSQVWWADVVDKASGGKESDRLYLFG